MHQHRWSTRCLTPLVALSLLASAACSGDDDDDGGASAEDEALTPADVMTADADVGEADPSCEGATDDVLRIGSLLPATGELETLGPPMFAGAQLAVTEINEAGGVNGQPIDYRIGDEGGANAGPTVEGHLAARVDMILGAASTRVSEDNFDSIVSSCTIMFSPANTSANFTLAEDDDLYFRTAPTDLLQGRVLATLAMEDSVGSAAILARDDGYGESLGYFVRDPLEANGVDVVVDELYDTDEPDIPALVDAVVEANPDAVFLIGYGETGELLQALAAEGFTPQAKKIYLADGNTSNALAETFTQPGALQGVRGTYPSAEVAAAFAQRLTATDPALVDVVYGPEAYDAVVLTALAAIAAGTDRPDEVARHINGLTRDGTPCTSFAQCRDLIAAGTDIDYNGPSGLLDFARTGEPTTATIAVLSFGADNRIDTAATQYRDVTINGLT